MVRWASMGTAALALIVGVAPPAAAQSEASSPEPSAGANGETEAARASFQAGLELADRGEWEQASARFREALALRDSPAVRTNLALSLAESGRVVEAVGELDRVLAEPTLDAAVRDDVEARRAVLSGQLGRLRIDVHGGPPDTRVTVDGQPWEGVGEFAWVQPRTLTVRLSDADRPLDTREAEVTAGGEVNVLFSLLSETPTARTDEVPLIVGLVAALALAVAGAIALTVALWPTENLSDGDFETPVLEID